MPNGTPKCRVQVSEDLKKAELMVGSSSGYDPKLGGPPTSWEIPPEKCKTIHCKYLGGGFRQKSMTIYYWKLPCWPRKLAPLPVKLIWTGRTNMRLWHFSDPYPLNGLKATVDKNGINHRTLHCVCRGGGNLSGQWPGMTIMIFPINLWNGASVDGSIKTLARGQAIAPK